MQQEVQEMKKADLTECTSPGEGILVCEVINFRCYWGIFKSDNRNERRTQPIRLKDVEHVTTSTSFLDLDYFDI